MLKNKANLLLGISVGIESNSVSIDWILNWCSIRLSWCWTCNQCHVICDLLQNLCDPTSSAIYFYLYVNINKPTSPLWSILISSTIPLFFSLWTYGNNPLRSTLIQNLSTRLKSSGKWRLGGLTFPWIVLTWCLPYGNNPLWNEGPAVKALHWCFSTLLFDHKISKKLRALVEMTIQIQAMFCKIMFICYQRLCGPSDCSMGYNKEYRDREGLIKAG